MASSNHLSHTVKEQIHIAVERVDGLIAGVIDIMHSSDMLILTGDHRNIESSMAETHTRNPMLLLMIERDASRFEHLVSIVQIADAVVATAQESLA